MSAAQVHQLPTAAASVVLQTRRAGRWPKMVTCFFTARGVRRIQPWEAEAIADAVEMANFQIEMNKRCAVSWQMELAWLTRSNLTVPELKLLARELAQRPDWRAKQAAKSSANT